jgi:REP element-mobilizing transposase RayT
MSAVDLAARMPQRKKLPHGTPAWVRGSSVYFITICCHPRERNQLCQAETAAVVFEAVAFRQRSNRWFAHLVLLMPDHLHALMSFPRDADMPKVMANFKELTAKRAGISWQRDFFDHRLRASHSLRDKEAYILMNPVRKGLAPSPECWPYVWRPALPDGGPSGPALPFR